STRLSEADEWKSFLPPGGRGVAGFVSPMTPPLYARSEDMIAQGGAFVLPNRLAAELGPQRLVVAHEPDRRFGGLGVGRLGHAGAFHERDAVIADGFQPREQLAVGIT